MRLKIFFTLLIVFVLAAAASAQTKMSGTELCTKPDLEYSIDVGDRPNHTYVIQQGKCSWTKPMEIAGIQTKEGIYTGFVEISGNTGRARGSYVETMANGDKAYYRYEGTSNLKDGVGETRSQLLRATGKLKGVKAKGTCKYKVAEDRSGTFDCEGEYELPK
jgi:hypothetical protein